LAGRLTNSVCLIVRLVERWHSASRRGAGMPATNDDPDSFGDRGPLLRWLVFTGLSVFAFVLLWRAMKS
jgi:hypothetical protein